MRIRQLEIMLEDCAGFPDPDARSEQYATPAVVAARFLHEADRRGDIRGMRVVDLGCGTGILACGAALLGAGEVIGIDRDKDALAVARKNAEKLGAEVTFLEADISRSGAEIPPADTVIMNPPFGAQRAHADRPFIDAGLASAEVVWGIFNSGSHSFLESYVRRRATIDTVISATFPIRRTFAHHTRDVMPIPVDFIRLVRTEEGEQ
ncbi:METTL5 family protein [Methanogenium organophilum]|uniref:METTL5 family protein n=1 Tax=Methanogenium organophilum TaxID=2199 RepID=A0A9X9S4S5_METOG|nr:METTL5 family protein [Methanogenium organophilum]WAI02009.1 METTL5 family protein [Methanogenium organophilum]